MAIRFINDGLQFSGRIWLAGDVLDNPPAEFANMTNESQVEAFGRVYFEDYVLEESEAEMPKKTKKKPKK